MGEILIKIWDSAIRTFLVIFVEHYPISAGVAGIAMVALWLNSKRIKYKKRRVEIHYHFHDRTHVSFESLTTVDVLHKELKEYHTALHGTRDDLHITSRLPNSTVRIDSASTGYLMNIVIAFDPPLKKGLRQISLEGSYEDQTLAHHQKLPFRLLEHADELVVVVHLPQTERITGALTTVQKPKSASNAKEVLWVWKTNVFVGVFHDIKPHWLYEITWNYESP